jgi:flavin reductase (DIM6/NTAB) family NADH-FMN oxidoreductase RutF
VAPFLLPGAEVGLSILGSDQRELATAFSVKGRPSAPEILVGYPHHRGPHTGSLLADGGLATLEGRVEQIIAAGDHVLVVIAVLESITEGNDQRGLVYHRRGYRNAI